MALPPLATQEDLRARGIDPLDTTKAAIALDVASAAIRDAAGCPISRVTATVRAYPDGERLALAGPIVSVDTVTVAGQVVTDFHDDDYGLTSYCGWGGVRDRVLVTYTFGLNPVPADIVDLTCSLAIAHMAHLAAGGGSTAGLTQVRVDDASESYSEEAAGQVSPAFLPAVTREWLASRFGGGVTVVSFR